MFYDDDADLAAIAVDRLVRAAHDAQGKLQLEAPVRRSRMFRSR